MAVVEAQGKQQQVQIRRRLQQAGKQAGNRRNGSPWNAGIPSSPSESWVSRRTFILLLNAVVAVALIGYSQWRGNARPSLDNGAFVSSRGSSAVANVAVGDDSSQESSRCSGHGLYEWDYGSGSGACRCHACFTGEECSVTAENCIIDVNQGDPTMFERFWRENGELVKTVILGWQRMSYYSDSKEYFFVETELVEAVRSLHDVVGNAITEGRHIVIGVGSTQLFQAALYALSSPTLPTPLNVVSLAPYYSAYPTITEYLRSALYRWAGDAATFEQKPEGEAFVELVTTPNNPTGEVRYHVVNGTNGALVHDLAYYWPHYTPITGPADFDIMLFTVSKATGHAGTRIGWAIVKDVKVAQKMAKFIELNTIGVSKDSQLRATQVLMAVNKGYRNRRSGSYAREFQGGGKVVDHVRQALFHFGSLEMLNRWMLLRSALEGGPQFSIPDFTPAFCAFFGETVVPTPAFAWIKCNLQDDCAKFLKGHGILTRSGVDFGADPRYVRLSMLDRRSSFEILMNRLAKLSRE